MAEQYFILCIYNDMFIYLWYLGYFRLLVIMNNAAINIQVQVSVGTYVFISIGYKAGCGIHMVSLFLIF